MTNLEIRLIPLDLVNQFMTLARRHIEAGLAHADLSYDQVRVFLANGNWHLLIALDAEKNLVGAYTLSVVNNPNDRTATLVTAGGRGLAHPSAFDQVCDIAKSLGATKIQCLAQPAAARLYRRAGLAERAILMEKRLWVE